MLLNDGGAPPLAPALQQEIHDSLQDLRPQCILDHLKVSYSLSADERPGIKTCFGQDICIWHLCGCCHGFANNCNLC